MVLIKPKVLEDDRGFFMETYKASDFAKAGVFPRRASAEASLTSFGTAHREVFPRRASAEGPHASLGATKK